jgi:hypothetical protein
LLIIVFLLAILANTLLSRLGRLSEDDMRERRKSGCRSRESGNPVSFKTKMQRSASAEAPSPTTDWRNGTKGGCNEVVEVLQLAGAALLALVTAGESRPRRR